MNIKIIDANDFNEFGGVTHADKSGNYKSLSVQEIRSALPTDGNNQFQYEAKFAPISGATGDIVLVSGVPGLDISVLNYTLLCSSASTVQFFASGVGMAGTALSGPMGISANGGISANDNEVLFTTDKGQSLICRNSAGTIAGHLSYKLG